MVTPAVQQKRVWLLAHESLPIAPWTCFAADEIEAVSAVQRSGKTNYWTGQEGRQFGEEFAHYVGAKYGICVANRTVALELALHALGIGPAGEVITTSRTFIASASCVVTRRARPVFDDLDEWESIYRSFTQRPGQLAYAEGGAS